MWQLLFTWSLALLQCSPLISCVGIFGRTPAKMSPLFLQRACNLHYLPGLFHAYVGCKGVTRKFSQLFISVLFIQFGEMFALISQFSVYLFPSPEIAQDPLLDFLLLNVNFYSGSGYNYFHCCVRLSWSASVKHDKTHLKHKEVFVWPLFLNPHKKKLSFSHTDTKTFFVLFFWNKITTHKDTWYCIAVIWFGIMCEWLIMKK